MTKIKIKVPTNQNFNNLETALIVNKTGFQNSVKSDAELKNVKKNLSDFSLTFGDLRNQEKYKNLVLYRFRKNFEKKDDSEIVLKITQDFLHKENIYFQTGLYVGKIFIGDFEIDIESRNDNSERLLFKRMLNYANNIFVDKSLDNSEKDEKSDFPLFEYLFLSSLQKASVLGFPQEYKKNIYHDLKVHGGLDTNNYIRKDIPFTGKISSRKNERNYVQSIIDVLFSALECCKEEIKNSFPRLSFITSELKASYSGRRPDLRTILNAKNHKTLNNPMFSGFKQTIQYADILLHKQGLKNSSSITTKNKISGFLLDISELWEVYLEKLLKKNFPDWSVSSQTELDLYKESFFNRQNYPDIIMEQDNKIVIFDAKFKRMNFENGDVDRNDLFQIHSYAGYYRELGKEVVLCGLIYPLKQRFAQNNCFTTLYGLVNSLTKFVINGIYIPQEESGSLEEYENDFIEQIKSVID